MFLKVKLPIKTEKKIHGRLRWSVKSTATKYFWSYPMVNRDESSVLLCFEDLVKTQFAKFPDNHKWKRFQTDGGKELLSKRVKEYLVSIKVTWTHSSTDTPQQNSISERNFSTMAERTLAMLLHSGLPKGMWWKAYAAAYLRRPVRGICRLWNVCLEVVYLRISGFAYGGAKHMYL